MKAVIFGAGNIGRGFLGLELFKSGYDIIFVEALESVVKDLRERKQFLVEYLDQTHEQITVPVRKTFHTDEIDDIAKCINDCDIVVTAVGPKNIYNTAPLIKKGIHNTRGKIVIAAENAPNNSWIIRDEISAQDNYTIFPRCAVDRIAIRDEDITKVERPFEWIIENPGKELAINGVQYVTDITPYLERKLLLLNGTHAVLGFLGYNIGIDSPAVAMQDKNIRTIIIGALRETGEALVAEYKFDHIAMNQYQENIITRFENQFVPDKIHRLARDPIRKLSERVIKAALLAEKHNLPTKNLEAGIQAALHYHNLDDKESCQLQSMLKNKGIDFVLQTYFNLSNDCELWKRLILAYKE